MIVVEQVRTHAGWTSLLPEVDEAHLSAVVAAVNAEVPKHVPAVRENPIGPWGPDIVLGAVILAHRWFTRRASPTGVAAYTETGAAYVSRWDADCDRLFGIGIYAPPAIG